MIKKLISFFWKRKIISIIAILIVLSGSFFTIKAIFSKGVETKYALAAVTKDMIAVSVSADGQVTASDEVSLQSKTSGDVISVNYKKGDTVKSGNTIVQINTRNALKAVKDAEVALANAKITLEELKEPTDELKLLQSKNSLSKAKEAKEDAEDDLEKAYEDGFNSVSNVFLELPDTVSGLKNILFSNSDALGGSSQINADYYASAISSYNDKAIVYKNDAVEKYNLARQTYDQNFNDYKSASRSSSKEDIEKLISETYETTKNVAEAVKSANNLVQLYRDEFSKRGMSSSSLATTHLSSLNSYTSKTNSQLSSILSAKSSITNAKKAITNAERTIEESTLTLKDLEEGASDIDIRKAELDVESKQNTLTDARQTLNDCSVRAPFDGVVESISVKKSDTVSNGTEIVKLITNQKIAEITLNESDIAKVKVGQKAMITFDAIEDLTMAGQVVEVDTVGTTNQGVVSYTVKIAFSNSDERIKPGMSASASIIIESKQDVLVVPTSAIKSSNSESYVEIPNEEIVGDNLTAMVLKNKPTKKQVEIGLSSDSYVEIISGIFEGDYVITKTTSSSSKTSSSTKTTNSTVKSTNAIMNMGGGGPPGGM